MTDHTRALLEEALKLPEDERESLAYEILKTLGGDDEPLSPDWREEIDRRIERILAGKAGPGLDWRTAAAEVRREVEQESRKRR